MTTTPKVVLITGAAGTLGRALVEAFRSAGWQVAAGCHQEPTFPAEENLLPLHWDLLDSQAAPQAVAAVRTLWGRVDALVNNAGVTADDLIPLLRVEEWDRVMAVNLKGVFHASRAVLMPMIHQRGGSILNVGSFVGQHGAVGQAAYASAKAALLGFTQALAAEVGRRQICVNALLPGVMKTRMTAQLSPERLEELRLANLLGGLSDPAEVARFAVFLTTLKQVSGQVFNLDSRLTRLF